MKTNRFINIGYGNVTAADRIICVVSPLSSPIKRLIQEAKDSGRIIDATYGRKTRAVLVMDSGHVVLTPLHAETIASRLNDKNPAVNDGLDEDTACDD